MSKQDLQNKRLDEVGRRLFKAAALESDEIERIAAAPHLFESVRAKIKTEQSRRKPKRFTVNFWNWQTATGAFAFLIVLTIGAALIFKSKDTRTMTAQIQPPQFQSYIIQTESQPLPDEVEDIKVSKVKDAPIVQRTDFKSETPKLKNQARKPTAVKHAQVPKRESEGAFYSLALAGNWEADGEDLQIVRAELSRSQLFALGVNIPVENETPKIKTDLLVSSNGVPRAIRFVE